MSNYVLSIDVGAKFEATIVPCDLGQCLRLSLTVSVYTLACAVPSKQNIFATYDKRYLKASILIVLFIRFRGVFESSSAV